MITRSVVRSTTPKGNLARFAIRDDTSDGALVGGISDEDEYGLADLPELSGWAIDIGAHIGIVSVALALDHPDLRIVAVEALPENVAVLRENVALNGLEERITVIEAAAGAEGETEVPITYGWANAPNQPDHYMADNRYIGGMVGPNESSRTILCPAVSLASLTEDRDIALLKIDCEGCEWFVLTSPALRRVQRVIGEMHAGRHGDAAKLRSLLADFDVTMDDAKVVSIFHAVRR